MSTTTIVRLNCEREPVRVILISENEPASCGGIPVCCGAEAKGERMGAAGGCGGPPGAPAPPNPPPKGTPPPDMAQFLQQTTNQTVTLSGLIFTAANSKYKLRYPDNSKLSRIIRNMYVQLDFKRC